ncbi:hypothetical protein H6P81_006466 [Aristolochia fimbriata]|uniref:Uncharacterized protein n=1 Tax=Aristolochia fimbriata TaxID=158543 RepID=A0AAV7EXJ8_ARIFI|nr:hypothetical protein H6P81_006466 [Aristolochia fimbriata]
MFSSCCSVSSLPINKFSPPTEIELRTLQFGTCSQLVDRRSPVLTAATALVISSKPVLVVALEKVERSSGSLIGSSIASIQKSTAPKMLLALMDQAYTGLAIEDREAGSGSDDNSSIKVGDSLFLDLLKDENDGLPERHWTSPRMAAALQAVVNSSQSERLKQALRMAPQLLDLYFAIALQDVNDCKSSPV